MVGRYGKICKYLMEKVGYLATIILSDCFFGGNNR